MNKETPPDSGGDKYAGKRQDSITEWPADLQHEAYELIIVECLKQLVEDSYEGVFAEKAMGEACRQIASLIRGQMTERHLEPNTLEPHGLALRLLESYERAYLGLLPDGSPDLEVLGYDSSIDPPMGDE